MANIILDDCLAAVYECHEIMKEYTPISEYQAMFEADDPAVQEAQAKNESVGSKAVSALKKAIDAVIGFIKKVTDAISDFFDRMHLDKAEETAFKEFREACKQDPSLANKKITVKDYRAYIKQMDEIEKEAEEALRKAKAGEKNPFEKVAAKMTDFLKGSAKEATVIVSADFVEKMALGNIKMAKAIKTAMTHDSSVLEGIRETLGDNRAEKFEKNINSFSKEISFRRLLNMFRKSKYDSLAKCIQEEIKDVKSIAGRGIVTTQVGRDVLGSKNLGGAIKGVTKVTSVAAVGGAKDAVTGIVSNEIKKTINPDKANKTGVYKSTKDFLFGTEEDRTAKKKAKK